MLDEAGTAGVEDVGSTDPDSLLLAEHDIILFVQLLAGCGQGTCGQAVWC